MYELIEHLKNKHWLWQGSETKYELNTHSTGFNALDEKLAGGFPPHGVVEIQSQSGIGELRLIYPYLKQHDKRLTVFINPPGIVQAESLKFEGIELDNVLVVTPRNHKESLWAAEQCLKSGACRQVLLWLDNLEVHQVRRLNVASETGNCLQFLFRSPQESAFSLPVSLSISLQSYPQGLKISVPKRKGGWPLGAFNLAMSERWPNLVMPHSSPQSSSTVITFPKRMQG
ncbi:translesion DNA synthesis-associated protein ImuA [Vibrio ziniensis]|uniref:Translesion DNA synthesis-associated protein ImuA n=1 Tax=Vibrio ziniensis TaxID=2711221 RepID=A0A6G7CJH1_9VIBR|nr:translesion DNA synthesis-associated protein ImuA [Vibrio ziniensis]QIH42267.1 translesion DNA synthesis-associated protein ImuA [Vibrio ziniensis]